MGKRDLRNVLSLAMHGVYSVLVLVAMHGHYACFCGLKCPCISHTAFPLEDVGWFSLQRCNTGRVSTAKSGRDPD